MSNATGARRRRKRNRKWGELIALAAEISGRAPKTVYNILEKRRTSARVQDAIDKARAMLAQARRKAA